MQAAAKKRSRRHQAETDEFILSNNDGALMDPVTLSTSYQKMKFLILSIKNEIFTDIEIHNQNVLPRWFSPYYRDHILCRIIYSSSGIMVFFLPPSTCWSIVTVNVLICWNLFTRTSKTCEQMLDMNVFDKGAFSFFSFVPYIWRVKTPSPCPFEKS